MFDRNLNLFFFLAILILIDLVNIATKYWIQKYTGWKYFNRSANEKEFALIYSKFSFLTVYRHIEIVRIISEVGTDEIDFTLSKISSLTFAGFFVCGMMARFRDD